MGKKKVGVLRGSVLSVFDTRSEAARYLGCSVNGLYISMRDKDSHFMRDGSYVFLIEKDCLELDLLDLLGIILDSMGVYSGVINMVRGAFKKGRLL